MGSPDWDVLAFDIHHRRLLWMWMWATVLSMLEFREMAEQIYRLAGRASLTVSGSRSFGRS